MHQTLKQSFGFLIHDAARLLARRFEVQARKQELTMPQWRVIVQLLSVGGQTQSALAKQVETDPVTLGGLVERLEAKGLVTRAPSPDDSRAKIVDLTTKAHALIDEMRAISNEVYAEAFEGISDADRATLISVLTRFNANLSKPSISLKQVV
jgi:MarR family transcriptional regulator for hemolysin